MPCAFEVTFSSLALAVTEVNYSPELLETLM